MAFILLLGLAWIVANPPGYHPDEPSHTVKALGTGRWQLRGLPGHFDVGPGFGPDQLKWINRSARVFPIPGRLDPRAHACSVFMSDRSASCLDQPLPPPPAQVGALTYVGSYEPYLYLPAGLVMNLANDAGGAVLLGRLVNGGISLALLCLGAAALWSRERPQASLAGLLLAVTPMVVFMSSGVSPAGPEVAAAVCCACVVLRLARAGTPPRWVWVTGGAAGFILATARSLGPFELAGMVALLVLLVGWRQARRLVRQGRWAARGALAAVVVGVGLNVAWAVLVQPEPPSERSIPGLVGPALRSVPEVLRHGVGSFGWQDVDMPRIAYAAWGLAATGLVVLALAVGTWKQRLKLLLVVAGCLVGTVAIATAVIFQTYFPMFGRYALPLWVTVPLYAGEIVREQWGRLPSALARVMLPVTGLTVVGVHATGWYVNARRYAVSDYGPVFFLGRSQWEPPWGWQPWMAVIVVGSALLILQAFVLARARPPLAAPALVPAGADAYEDARSEGDVASIGLRAAQNRD